MVHHILVSSAETRRAFNTGFDTVNLHRPTKMTAGAPAEEVAVTPEAAAVTPVV